MKIQNYWRPIRNKENVWGERMRPLKNFKSVLFFIVVNIITDLAWIGLEKVVDGKIVSLNSDTIINYILSYLITDKILCYIDELKREK